MRRIRGGQSSVIKASKLLDWIKANLGKIDADYKKSDFFENEAIVDVPLYVSGTNKETIKLYAELGHSGKLNLYKDQDYGISGIQVSFDLTNKFHNGFNLSFTYSDKTMTETPVKLWCYSYKDFENLLQYLGLKLNQPAKTRIIQDYKNAIQAANGNCDKLDVIYETIPDFVLSELTDKLLLENLNSLASCQMSDMVIKFLLGWGVDTNDELAALNIVRNIKDKLSLFNYLNANPRFALNLYQKIDGEKNREELIKIFLEISQVYWDNNTTLVNNAYRKENIFFLINGIQNHGKISGNQVELWGVRFAGGISTVHEITPTGLHDLFAPVYVVFTQEANTNNNLYYTVPAIYFYHIVQAKDLADNIKTLELIAQSLSVYASAYTIVSATGKIAKTIAWTSLLNDATRLFFDNSNLKTYIGAQPWGEDFIKGYYALSTGIYIVNIAQASVTALASNASEVRKVLVANNTTAEKLAEYDRWISKVVKNASRFIEEELDILKFAIQQNKKYLIKGGVLTLASVATQFAGNMCYFNGDVNNSIDNVDLFDAVVDGYTMEIGMTGNAIFRLFKNSNKAYIYKAGKLFLIEFSKVTIDLSPTEGIMIKNYFNTEDQQKAMMVFILNLSTKYTSDQISNMLKNWSKLDLQTLYATATTEEREMMQTIDKIVNSEKFKVLLEAPINTVNQVVSQVIENIKLPVEVKKINTKTVIGNFDTIIKMNENLPDNTRVEILNKYRYENQ